MKSLKSLKSLKRRRGVAACAGALIMILPAAVNAQAPERAPWLKADELRQTFSGRQVSGHYRHGMTFIERYLEAGRLTNPAIRCVGVSVNTSRLAGDRRDAATIRVGS